ncbi:hypothetical protein [Actinotignum sp. GS-2025c]|uniref:hypothetical protein n=1 Tax=Actinotignum sp. GS-2025c TaxID=3427276 RepID=UPI003F482AB3
MSTQYPGYAQQPVPPSYPVPSASKRGTGALRGLAALTTALSIALIILCFTPVLALGEDNASIFGLAHPGGVWLPVILCGVGLLLALLAGVLGLFTTGRAAQAFSWLAPLGGAVTLGGLVALSLDSSVGALREFGAQYTALFWVTGVLALILALVGITQGVAAGTAAKKSARPAYQGYPSYPGYPAAQPYGQGGYPAPGYPSQGAPMQGYPQGYGQGYPGQSQYPGQQPYAQQYRQPYGQQAYGQQAGTQSPESESPQN